MHNGTSLMSKYWYVSTPSLQNIHTLCWDTTVESTVPAPSLIASNTMCQSVYSINKTEIHYVYLLSLVDKYWYLAYGWKLYTLSATGIWWLNPRLTRTYIFPNTLMEFRFPVRPSKQFIWSWTCLKTLGAHNGNYGARVNCRCRKFSFNDM